MPQVPGAYQCMLCFGLRCAEDPWSLFWGVCHSVSKYWLAPREGALRLQGSHCLCGTLCYGEGGNEPFQTGLGGEIDGQASCVPWEVWW